MKRVCVPGRAGCTGLLLALYGLVAWADAALPAPADGASAPAGDAPQQIVVTGARELPLVSYAKLFEAMQAVERAKPQLGPQARVAFYLRPVGSAASAAASTVASTAADDPSARPTVTLLGKTTDLVLPVADDLRVDIPFTQALLDDGADLRVTGRQYARNLRIWVSTPGAPPGHLRLGDLRLFCVFGQALARSDGGFWLRAAIDMFGVGACPLDLTMPEGSAPPHVVAGTRREALPLRNKAYAIPVHLKSWPDDAWVVVPGAAPADRGDP